MDPSFNIDEWMKELLPDDGATNLGMESMEVPGSSSNASNLNEENKFMNLEEKHQVDLTIQVDSTKVDLTPSATSNQMDTSSDFSNNPRESMQPSTLSNIQTELSQSQTSHNMALHSQQHQHLFLQQTTQRPVVPAMSMQHTAYLSTQRQQQRLQRQSTPFRLAQQQPKVGYHSSSSMMNNRGPLDILQCSDQALTQNLQRVSQSMQMQHALGKQIDSGPEGAQLKFQGSAFPRSQNLMIVDQQNSAQQSRPRLLRPSLVLDSSSQTGISSIDWIEPALRQIQMMKEMHYSDTMNSFRRILEMQQQATNADAVTKWEKNAVFLDQILRFLQFTRTDVIHHGRERIQKYISEVTLNLERLRGNTSIAAENRQQFVEASSCSSAPRLQQTGRIVQFSSPNQGIRSTPTAHMPQLLVQQGPLNMQARSMNPFQVASSIGLQKTDSLLLMNSLQYSLMRSAQPTIPARAPQGRSSPQRGAQIGLERRSLGSLLHPSAGVSRHNSTSAENPRPLPPNPVAALPPQIRRQDPQQMVHSQKLKQPVQPMHIERNKQQIMQKMNEDTKLGQFQGFNQRMMMHQPIGQQLQHSPLMLLQSSSNPYQVASPQSSQHSPAQLEHKDLQSKFSSSNTPVLSAASPSAVPSPRTPLTPSSAPVDPEKSPSYFQPSSLEDSNTVPKSFAAPFQFRSQSTDQHRLIADDTEGRQKDPCPTESTGLGDTHRTTDEDSPIQRLVKVVESISQKALDASLEDISRVTDMMDKRAGDHLQGSSNWISGKDLADDIRNHGEGNFHLLHETEVERRMKRELSTMDINDLTSSFHGNASFECSSDLTCELDLSVTSSMKKLKKEADGLLMQEIREINKKLIETMVEVVDVRDDLGTRADQGTIVRISYTPLGHNGNVTLSDGSTFSSLLLELCLPIDYPISSPIVLDSSTDYSAAEELRDLQMNVKSKFSLSLRKLSNPISLEQMAEAWDVSAREVFREFTLKMGGGDFSSTYGKWENFVSAA